MKQGLVTQIGNITTLAGAASGAAGANLNFNLGAGNAAGNSNGGSLNIKPGASSGTGLAGVINIQPTVATAGGTTALRFLGTNGTNYVAFKAPDSPTNTTYTLPTADGTANQFLQTNGSGTLAWTSITAANVFATIAGNTGTAVVDAVADTLTFTGTTGIQTVASDTAGNDVLTLSLTRTGLSAKATPVAADSFLMFNSAASDAPVYATASTVAAAIGAVTTARIVRGTFQNAGLTSGSIAVTHGLNVAGVLVQVYDETGKMVQPDDIALTSNTVTTVDLSSFGTISGTWSYVIFG